MSRTLVVFIGLCLVLVAGERIRYDNYHVYKVTATHETQLKLLQEVEGASDSILFLDGPYALNRPIQVIAAPHKVPDFIGILARNGLLYDLITKDAQSLFLADEAGFTPRATYDWTSYHTLDETYSWLKSLVAAYPNQVSLISAGKSYEGRDILGLKISYKGGNKGIFIEGGIHAREWISPATVTYLINQLLTSTVTSVRNIAENNDWYIFPNVNPDGYMYTWTNDRMWRKTRTPYGTCFGADPNRNWDFYWNTAGSSNNKCSDTYAGPSAASEIEVKSLQNYLTTLKGNIQVYISFHSYSQYLLYPFGHTGTLPENVADIKTVYNATISALNKRYGTMYTGGNIYDAIYPASGSSIDWAYSNVDTKLAYSFELRPSGSSGYGFQLPASQIAPTGAEIMDAIVAMVDTAKDLNYL